MLIDKVNQQIKDLNSIRNHNSIVENASKQKSIDEKFRNLVFDTKKYLEIIKYCNAEF